VPVPLMLATLTDRRELGPDWLLERKFDGERCLALKDGDEVRLESRTGKDLTGTYPEVRDAVAAQRPRRLVLDGEVVAFEDGQTSFGRLQQRLGVRAPSPELVAAFPVVYCVFDLLDVTARISAGGRWSSGATASRGRSGRGRACSRARPGGAIPSGASPRRAGRAGRG
jgi:ATP-dependent DNA ligase